MEPAAAPAANRFVSALCWCALVAHTLVFAGLATVLEPIVGRRAWHVLLHRWARACLWTGAFRCRVERSGPLPAPAVLVTNHRSAFDVAVLAAVVPPPAIFVARRELLRVPAVGGVLRRGGHVVVERGDGRDGSRALLKARAHLARGAHVVFFPEGRRSRDGRVGPFLPGAFAVARMAGCPVIPVAIAGTELAIPPESGWIRPGVPVRVAFLPALGEEDRAEPGRAAAAARGAIDAWLSRAEAPAAPAVAGLPSPEFSPRGTVAADVD